MYESFGVAASTMYVMYTAKICANRTDTPFLTILLDFIYD